jgi:hypothetical protein
MHARKNVKNIHTWNTAKSARKYAGIVLRSAVPWPKENENIDKFSKAVLILNVSQRISPANPGLSSPQKTNAQPHNCGVFL